MSVRIASHTFSRRDVVTGTGSHGSASRKPISRLIRCVVGDREPRFQKAAPATAGHRRDRGLRDAGSYPRRTRRSLCRSERPVRRYVGRPDTDMIGAKVSDRAALEGVPAVARIVVNTRSAGRRRSPAGSLAATLLFVGAVFLAHGLQCAAGQGHDAVATSHPPTVLGTVDASIHTVDAGVGLLFSVAVPQLGHLVDPAGADGLSHAGMVCVAVLLTGAVFAMSLTRRQPSRGDPPPWPARNPGVLRTVMDRRLPPPPTLALLCVCRT